MKITTDHFLPSEKFFSVTGSNLPSWKASVLNGWTLVLMRDMRVLLVVDELAMGEL